MTEPQLQLATMTQALQNADVYLRGVDSFLKAVDMRVQVAEHELAQKQAKHDADIAEIVRDMHAKAQEYFES
ncbi:MAG: hypothetical protein A3E36_02795 [Candidatus Andersenbacteria bacterium RIFCSPHIGHO2_12_FULL_45_11b]|uniref:Uncharacterized protein n=1 Tax=Candidatus Andersenbacteria bacterium RIFCSPHIGHO2_12_FULL_45_11b TaxID=1797282 RepID=A0A1G1XCL6_9BACT|nr:MAG: hypothetical protein A3E36_02795 [Candidatus Andersenbacteria bacterium RIFCSPHIGHO2_12_FULL_45_11b]